MPVKASPKPSTLFAHQLGNVATGPRPPVWEGPTSRGKRGGITQSLLGKYLSCKERFRLYAIEGYKPTDRWQSRTGYGDMWHSCEEALAAGNNPNNREDQWHRLETHCYEMLRRYPMQQSEIEHWFMVCKAQFPLYVRYWQQHEHVQHRRPLMQEECFDVDYKLPDGRVVRLRGKYDSVDLVTRGDDAGIWLQENKTKSDIDEAKLRRQLKCDLQSMLYLVSLDEHVRQHITQIKDGRDKRTYWGTQPIRGVRYNVIKRPLSGGKGTIVQRQPTEGSKCPKCNLTGSMRESRKSDNYVTCTKCGGKGRIGAKPGETRDEFYDRVASYIRDNPSEYFMRWSVEITPDDLARFRTQVLDPALTQLCDWYEWVSSSEGRENPFAKPSLHGRLPYGAYNSVAEDRIGDYDHAMDDNNFAGLARTNDMFSELA